MPECVSARGTMILAIQSVPGSRYVSCVEGLLAGWEYNDLVARNGTSSYSLDSDRMGNDFVRVDNVLTCQPGAGLVAERARDGVELSKDVVEKRDVEVVVIPEGPTEETVLQARTISVALEDAEIHGRAVAVTTSESDEPTADKIQAAVAQGAHVVVISIRDAEEGTVTLLLSGSVDEIEVSDLDSALDRIEDVETESSYVGSWYYMFEGGCVIYTFDAQGSGTATLDRDIQVALSLFNAEELRQLGRDAGFRMP